MELNSGPSESCNARLSIASNFCFNETESRKLQTPLTSMVPFLGVNLAETTSPCHPHPQTCKEATKHSRGTTRGKLPWWKLNEKKTQRRGSDKKPGMLDTRTVKNKLSRKLTQLSLIPKDLWLRKEGLTPMAGRTYA